MINHFRDVCPGSTYSIHIIEVFKGDGCDNNKVCPEARKIRVDRENFWKKELRTIFPYELNERAIEARVKICQLANCFLQSLAIHFAFSDLGTIQQTTSL